MPGSLHIVLTARDQFTRLETLEIAFFSDSGNGLPNAQENEHLANNFYELFPF